MSFCAEPVVYLQAIVGLGVWCLGCSVWLHQGQRMVTWGLDRISGEQHGQQLHLPLVL
jgi:hypothetical protein